MKTLTIPIILTGVLILVSVVISWTLSTVIIFVPVLILSFIFYLRTFHHRMPAPTRILPVYLLCLGIQMIHFAEEYCTGFVTKVPALFSQDPYPLDYWVVFNMVAYAIFILGGIIIFKRLKSWMIIPIFFILFAVILNAIAHIFISIYVGGYFPGLFTALIYAMIGPYFMKLILRETRPPKQ